MCATRLFPNSEFYGSLMAAPAEILNMLTVSEQLTGEVPDDQKITIFAPTNAAYYNLMKRLNDFSQDLTTLTSVSEIYLVLGTAGMFVKIQSVLNCS